jgi:putative tricarboxylic transport membrane protein
MAIAGAAADWKPARNVEIIVPSSPGGAQDRTARVLQQILQEAKLVEPPVALSHKPGAAHAVAATFLSQHPGDGHFLLTSTSTLLTTHILGVNRYNYTDFTPVAMLSSEYVGFAVSSESPLRTPAELVQRLQANAESVTFAFGTSRGNVNHIGIGQVMKAAGIDPSRARAVVYRASPEAMAALLGGHVDCVAAPLSNFSPLLKTGQVRVIAVAAPRRSEGQFAAVPTWTESGWPAISDNFRMVLGAKGLDAGQRAFWDEAFERLTRRGEWRKELESNALSPEYLRSSEARARLEQRYGEYQQTLHSLGLLKNKPAEKAPQ